jgi:hypothetical protein
MIFDGNVTVISAGVDDVEGNDNALNVELTLGIILPGAQGAMAIPAARIRFLVDRETALQWGGAIVEKGEALKPPSDLAIATDLSQADKLAKDLNVNGPGDDQKG